jgi:isopentenyl-diphosphate delta-isomerase type 1
MDDPASPNPAENDEELLDLLDEAGKVVGRVRRGEVHGNPSLRHRAVHIFVRNSRGDLYLQKRSRLKRVAPGLWDTSVGGHVPSGESYEQGALRELEEELGIVLPDAAPLERSHDWVWSTGFETEHTRTYLLRWDGVVRPDPLEVEEGRWWTEEELRAASGKGVLTDNLEKELANLGLLT